MYVSKTHNWSRADYKFMESVNNNNAANIQHVKCGYKVAYVLRRRHIKCAGFCNISRENNDRFRLDSFFPFPLSYQFCLSLSFVGHVARCAGCRTLQQQADKSKHTPEAFYIMAYISEYVCRGCSSRRDGGALTWVTWRYVIVSCNATLLLHRMFRFNVLLFIRLLSAFLHVSIFHPLKKAWEEMDLWCNVTCLWATENCIGVRKLAGLVLNLTPHWLVRHYQ